MPWIAGELMIRYRAGSRHAACWMQVSAACAVMLSGVLMVSGASAAGAPSGPTASIKAPGKPQAHDAFQSHGIPTPLAQSRGVVTTVDAEGRDIVLSWLQDHRGGYSLLWTDAETGQTRQFDTPFPPNEDEPFALLLSSRNRLYTLFNGHFIEFDVREARFSFWRKTQPGTAMSLAEDRSGAIWAATYPASRLLRFEPDQAVLTDLGVLARRSWAQYPRSMAVDSAGWVYVGVGLAATQIYAFHPEAGQAKALLPANTPPQKQAPEVWLSRSNSVFARVGEQQYLLSGGKIQQLPEGSQPAGSDVTTGAQNLFDQRFPSGRALLAFDMSAHRLRIRDVDGKERTLSFTYKTQGAALTQVCATDDGQVCGGTRFPMHVFRYKAGSPRFESQQVPRQPNVIEPVDGHWYVGAYPDGTLLDVSGQTLARSEKLASANPAINRPHALVVQSHGPWVAMAGTPDYGRTGGGLLLWNRQDHQSLTLTHQALIPKQATQALIELPNGWLLGGTTLKAGTGGVDQEGDSAHLYLLDPETRQLLWKGVPVSGARIITDLIVRDDGLVYGLADSTTLFVFDPSSRRVINTHPFGAKVGAAVFAQGTRALIRVPAQSAPSPHQPRAVADSPQKGAAQAKPASETIYLLLTDGVARIDPLRHEPLRVATAPVEVSVGGAYVDGRIYFGSKSILYSWQVP